MSTHSAAPVPQNLPAERERSNSDEIVFLQAHARRGDDHLQVVYYHADGTCRRARIPSSLIDMWSTWLLDGGALQPWTPPSPGGGDGPGEPCPGQHQDEGVAA